MSQLIVTEDRMWPTCAWLHLFRKGWCVCPHFGPGEVWLPGIVTQVSGPGSYSVELSDGRCVRRRHDHLRQCCDMQPISLVNSHSSKSAPTDPTAGPVSDSLPTTTPTPDQRDCPSPHEHNTPPPSPSQLQRSYPHSCTPLLLQWEIRHPWMLATKISLPYRLLVNEVNFSFIELG